MSFPSGVLTATLTFSNPLTFLGNEATRTELTVQPSAGVVWAATGQPIDDFAEIITPGPGLPGQLNIPFVDQDGFTDQAGNSFKMWAYVLTRKTFFGNTVKTVKKYWQPLIGQDSTDFDNLPGGTVGLPVAVSPVPVTSVAGEIGAVSAEALVGKLSPYLPDGVTPESVEANLPERLEATALSATYATSLNEALIGVNYFANGHSYVAGDQEIAGSKWPDRVATMLRTGPITNTGVNGSRSSQTAVRLIRAWTPGTRGLYVLQSVVNDMRTFGPVASGPATTYAAFRAMLAMLTAGLAVDESADSFEYHGTGWAPASDTTAVGSTVTRTSTVGDYVDVAWNGDTAYVLTQFSTTAGTVTVKDSVTQSVVQTINLGGCFEKTPAVIALRGYGAGPHTVRLTLTAGTAFTIDSLLIPSATPPAVVIVKEGPGLAYNTALYASVAAATADLLGSYTPVLDALLTEFPTLLLTRQGGPSDWDTSTMLVSDGLHPNPIGSASIAREVVRTVKPLTFRNGLNALATPAAITTTIPTYIAGTPAVPSAPTLGAPTPSDTSVALTWTRPANNGAVITDYKVEYRIGAGAWTTFTHAASTALAITVTGLTNGTAYDFRVSAVNSAGAGAVSNTVTSTPFLVVTTFSDNFTRADSTTSLGSTPVGALAYSISGGTVATPKTATFGISSNRGYASLAQADSNATVDPGNVDGVLRLTVTALPAGGDDYGLVNRFLNQDNFWLLWGDRTGGFYKVMKKVSGAYTTLFTSTVPLAVNDVLRIDRVAATGAQTFFVNDAQIYTTTDAALSTNTKVGVRASTQNGAGQTSASRFSAFSLKSS
jgi:hypothetical protein